MGEAEAETVDCDPVSLLAPKFRHEFVSEGGY